MSQSTPDPIPAAPADPAPAAPAAQVPTPAPPATQSLEDLLADLDDDRRKVILEQVNKPRKEAQSLRERLKAAEPQLAEYDRLVQASKTDLERAQEQAKTASERLAKSNERVVRAEVRAAAADRFVDAEVPFAFLDQGKYVSSDGEVDTAAIAADLNQLLIDRPGLAKAPGSRVPAPNPAQGSSGGGSPTAPAQISQTELKEMYAKRQYAEIEAARLAGRFDGLLGAPTTT